MAEFKLNIKSIVMSALVLTKSGAVRSHFREKKELIRTATAAAFALIKTAARINISIACGENLPK